MTQPTRTKFAFEPDPAHPGWSRWVASDASPLNRDVLGALLIRRDGAAGARVRMAGVAPRHANLRGALHGGVTMTLIDVALFGTINIVLDIETAGAVTLDVSCQFIGAGRTDRPLEAIVEVLRETGRLVFLRGLIEQEGTLIAAFGGTIRKPRVAR